MNNSQKFVVSFEYSASIFEDDPEDIFLVADLEKEDLLKTLAGFNVNESTLKVTPLWED